MPRTSEAHPYPTTGWKGAGVNVGPCGGSLPHCGQEGAIHAFPHAGDIQASLWGADGVKRAQRYWPAPPSSGKGPLKASLDSEPKFYALYSYNFTICSFREADPLPLPPPPPSETEELQQSAQLYTSSKVLYLLPNYQLFTWVLSKAQRSCKSATRNNWHRIGRMTLTIRDFSLNAQRGYLGTPSLASLIRQICSFPWLNPAEIDPN